MWLLFAFLSAVFAGLTAILSKIGIKNTDSDLATAIRTIVVLLFAWLMVFLTGGQAGLGAIDKKTLLFLVLSGFATGASWLCYFKALQLGNVNKVTPIDKSSTVLTMLLACLLLGETMTVLKAIAMVLIAVGTYLMIQRKAGVVPPAAGGGRSWFFFAAFSAVFAALTSILGKIGIQGIDSNLGTAIRTCVVLIMAWVVVFVQGKQRKIRHIDKKSMLFILLSGLATGASWLCYYRALQDGDASIVVPIDKLSILLTIAFSYFILKEKLSVKSLTGLVLIVAGTLTLLI